MRNQAAVLLVFATAFHECPAFASETAGSESWVASWACSPEAADADASEPLLSIENQTVRERVRLSLGGDQIRLRLSNEFGTSELQLGAVVIALPNGPSGIQPGSIRRITFDGHDACVIPAGAYLLSDAVPFPAAAGAEISISIYFPHAIRGVTWHALALKRSVDSASGDHTRDETIPGRYSESEMVVSGVLVRAAHAARVVVAFGDSLVDGDGTALDAEQGWPSCLARRLQSTTATSNIGVVNEGVAGNRLLNDGPLAILGRNAVARFDRDVLAQPGVTHVVVLEGINDIGFPGARLGDLTLADASASRTADDVIAAYRQLIARARLRGVKVIGCTLLPFEGTQIAGYFSEAKEATRQKVNAWIRNSRRFDGVVDFDEVLRDPAHPARLLPRLASADRLHPNAAGYRRMAEAIDLSLFR